MVRTTFHHAIYQREHLPLSLDHHHITDKADEATGAMLVLCRCVSIYFVRLGVRFQHRRAVDNVKYPAALSARQLLLNSILD
jgi:hypothetical protein